MSMVDKRRLSDALKPDRKKPTLFEFAWGHCIDDDVLLGLCISGVGDIPVPISLMVFSLKYSFSHRRDLNKIVTHLSISLFNRMLSV